MAPGRGGEDRREVGKTGWVGEGEEENRNRGLGYGEHKRGRLREKGSKQKEIGDDNRGRRRWKKIEEGKGEGELSEAWSTNYL